MDDLLVAACRRGLRWCFVGTVRAMMFLWAMKMLKLVVGLGGAVCCHYWCAVDGASGLGLAVMVAARTGVAAVFFPPSVVDTDTLCFANNKREDPFHNIILHFKSLD